MQKLTTQLVREYDVICLRDEPLEDMVRDYRYAKYLSDAGWGGLISQLSYKCEWYGKELIKINNWHPSTQICNSCGCQRTNMSGKKRQREWDCPSCGTRHNREVNAAKNILNEGLRQKAAS